MPDNEKTLYYLDELPDFKVADDGFDVRGWLVYDAAGRTIGRVESLLVSKAAKRVVYLDVEVNEGVIAHKPPIQGMAEGEGMYAFLNKDGDDYLIIPVGLVQLDEDEQRVLTPQIDFNTFASAGRFAKGSIIDREYEIYLRRHYLGEAIVGSPADTRDAFYGGREFEHHLNRQSR